MPLVFTTHPIFLRRHFRTSRRRLQGKEIIIFSATNFHRSSVVHVAATQHTRQFSPLVKRLSLFAIRTVLMSVMVGSILLIGSMVLPEIYVRLFPERSADVAVHTETPLTTVSPTASPELKKLEPSFDETLPERTWIRIPKIGVDTEAQPTAVSNEALDTGVWLVPDFGRPGDDSQPIIMAAHRFGWKWWWQNDYWKKHSFYLLTETQPGDQIEVIYNQRKWVYEIYASEEGTEITDYDADLILYTCKFLNSPERYFRYAKLVPPV